MPQPPGDGPQIDASSEQFRRRVVAKCVNMRPDAEPFGHIPIPARDCAWRVRRAVIRRLQTTEHVQLTSKLAA
jgi:hypothetical protein